MRWTYGAAIEFPTVRTLAETRRQFSRIWLVCLDTALVLLSAMVLSVTPATAGTPNPTLLPVATVSQFPLTAPYNALNVPSLAAGGAYLDPTTSARVYKLTTAIYPTSSPYWSHDYSEGGDEVSLPYNGNTRAVLVRQNSTSGGPWWLLDFTPGAGVSNPRQLTGNLSPWLDGAFAFSNNPATPYYAYVSNGSAIVRFDIRTMTAAPGNGWPISETNATWLHQSESDGLFVWMLGPSGPTVVGYEPSTGTRKTYTNSGLNEPRIDRAGRYIGLSMDLPWAGLVVWDWQTNSVLWTTDGLIPFAHNASLRGRWVTVDWNLSFPDQFSMFTPGVPNSAAEIGGPAPGTLIHGSGNWIQHPVDLNDQWAVFLAYGSLYPTGSTWLAPGGMILMTPNGERRLLGHAYNTTGTYNYLSFAKFSSDGQYVLFTSDMNGSGRSDVFLAELPQAAGTNPVPVLASLAPTSATAGGTALTLTATGTNFVSGSVVQWNGNTRTTTFVSSTQLKAAITATDLATAGTAAVTVASPGSGTSGALTFTITAAANPSPTLSSLAPTSATAGSAALTLTATGANFVASSVVQWNGNARTTTFVTSTQLKAAISTTDLATVGTAAVTVASPSPGGGTSGAPTFTITAASNPSPTLSSLAPTSATAGSAALTLTATGTNFVASSVVQWNGSTRATTFVSSTQLKAAIAATDLATAGTTSVAVSSPTPGGGTSGASTFTITTASNPTPMLSSLSPSIATAGGTPLTLTATGTNFVAGSVVQWNGGARTTTFVSSTQLKAAITATDLAAAGTASVSVFSPTPGGGTSGAVTFTMTAGTTTSPTPTINTGLVGYWTFDDGSGTMAVDASGNGSTGTLVNGPLWTTGLRNLALAFDGLTNYVSVPSTSALNAYPLTLAVWVKTSTTTGVRGIVNKYAAGSYNGYQLFMNNGNLCAWYLRDTSNYVYDGSGCPFNVSGYNDNRWHHVVYVVDASGGKLYVDGAQKAGLPWTGTAAAAATTQPIYIARYPGAYAGAEYLPGVLDDVRIYNRALSATEVFALYGGDTIPPSVSLIAPTAGATMQGVVTVAANATDNVGVVGVQFKLDGANLGTELIATPYALGWDTSAVANGTHSLTAVARDAAGNLATALPVSVSVANSTTNTTLTSGLVGYWTFDDGTGSTAVDSSGNGNTGTLVNGPLWTTGEFNLALGFDGLTNYVNVPSTAALNAYPLTVAVWVKTSTTTGVRGIVNKYAGGSYNGYQVFMNNGNLCAWYLRDASNYVYNGSGCTLKVAGYNDNHWHHVAYVIDASGGKLYVDGVQKAHRSWSGIAGAPTTTQPIHIAHYPGAYGGAEYLPGGVDDVRIYNRALSATEVSALYTAGTIH